MVEKNLYTISPRLPFIDALAHGLLERASVGDSPFSEYLVLLPNRRSCRSLKEALLHQNKGKTLLLPRIRAIADVESSELFSEDDSELSDIRPVMSDTRRSLLLTKIIIENINAPIDHAINLAEELGSFLDEMQIHQLSLDNLEKVVPEELSEHWQKTLDILKLLSDEWPSVLVDEGVMDAHQRRNKLLEIQGKLWQRNTPDFPIIAAGSTGSQPSTAKLLKIITELPKGEVILPGVDLAMDNVQWESLEDTHPQRILKSLIEDSFGIDRSELLEWESGYESESPKGRGIFVRELMRPAGSVSEWTNLKLDKLDIAGVKMLDAPTLDDEASAIALMMRAQLENKDKTAALVTNDKGLSKRVATVLQRWGVRVDDSSGIPLVNSEAATFLLLISEMVSQRMSPVSLLSVLKHRLCACGYDKDEFAVFVSQLEINILRGPRIEGGLNSIEETLNEKDLSGLSEVIAKLKVLAERFTRIFAKGYVEFGELLKENIELAESLSATDSEDGYFRFWKSDANYGGELRKCLEEVVSASKEINIDPLHYNKFLKTLLQKSSYWPNISADSRLSILSPIEARLQHFDLMILGELNKGSWPISIQTNWLSKTMRSEIGLPPEERLFGLSAHDFASFLFAPEVVITRAEKVNSSPTIPSPWWMRMETVAKVVGLEDEIKCDNKWIEWSYLLDQADNNDSSEYTRPAPVPPVESRPRSLSVTQVEKLVRDPYSVYASHILGLRKLEDLDQEPDMSDYGNIIHNILDQFTKNYENGSYADLIECGKAVFSEFTYQPSVEVMWWPRFEQVAEWFIKNEVMRRAKSIKVFAEIDGYVTWRSDAGEFKLKARADRIEVSKNGEVSIIDYKTGTLPSKKDMNSGLAPQISLEGWIAEQGGFPDVAGEVTEAACWKVSIGEDLGKAVSADIKTDETGESIKMLISFFDNKESPYIACPDNRVKPLYNDYEHLERLKELE